MTTPIGLHDIECSLRELRQTEVERAKISLQYQELEKKIHNQVKARLAEKAEPQNISKNKKPINKKLGTSTCKLPESRGSNTSLLDDAKQKLVVKRIEQCRESLTNIEKLSERRTEGQIKFLRHLENLNSKLWRNPVLENSAVAQLESLLSSNKRTLQ